MITVDLATESVRDLNQRLHDLPAETNERAWRIVNPKGGEVHKVEITREDGKKAMSRLKVGDKITAYVTESLLVSVSPV